MPTEGRAGGPGRRGPTAHLAPVHESLPLLAEERFQAPVAAHRLVTFLNRSLKRRGLVFGLTQDGSEVRIRIYDTGGDEHTDEKEGDGIGDERNGEHGLER